MFFTKMTRIVLLLFLLFFHPCCFAWAKETPEPTIEDIIITTSSSHLLLFATVKNSFTEQMLEGVRNGIPVTFSFDIQLNRIRSYWPDLDMAEENITHTLTYDAIKEEYAIRFSEQSRPRVTKSQFEAKQLMAEISGLEVIELKALEPDAPYSIQIKATLVENTLPLGMHYVIPFTSLWNFETDWRIIDFRY